jgi:hypothetical protein
MSSRTALLFALAHEHDGVTAASLADRLGSLSDAESPAEFPAAWVKAKVGESIANAVFAIGHCSDQDTLDDIACTLKPRSAVIKALVANPALRPLTGRSLRKGNLLELRLTRMSDEEVTAFADAAIAKPEYQLPKGGDLLALARHLVRIGHGEYVDRLLKAETQCDGELLDGLLAHVHRPGDPDTLENRDIFSACTYSPAEVLEMISHFSHPTIIDKLVSGMQRSTLELRPLGVDLVKIALTCYPPSCDQWRPASEWLTPEAIRLCEGDSWWFSTLSAGELGRKRLAKVIENTPYDRKNLLTALLRGEDDYPYVSQILETAGWGVDWATRPHVVKAVWVSENRDLWAEFLSHCDIEDLVNLLFGGIVIRREVGAAKEHEIHGVVETLEEYQEVCELVLPPLELIGTIVENLPADRVLHDLAESLEALPEEYILRLVDIVPGAGTLAGDAGTYKAIGQHIYDSLKSSGVDIELALDLYGSRPDAALNDVIDALGALARGGAAASQLPELVDSISGRSPWVL